jgi:protein-S-isoprenylcysteine O-methyltransferase Ste14
MYTGILLLGASIGLAIGTWLVPLLASLVFGLMAVRTRIEERYLLERFGEEYRAYMQRVGRFVPKLANFK